MCYKAIRSFLFLLPPETAHRLTIHLLNFADCCGFTKLIKNRIKKPVEVNNIQFANPIGIAAGFDKHAETIDAIANLGIGFIEVGTFTPKPQIGNPKPRLFRLKKSNALINRMGFNNIGIDAAIKKIEGKNFSIPVGISISKNNSTDPEDAITDYLYCLGKAYPHCDYIAVNISCPNVPNPAAFWTGKSFAELLTALRKEQVLMAELHKKYVPLYLKLSPDLTDENIKDCAEIINHSDLDGVIACNTTSTRPTTVIDPERDEKGGLSGEPLFDLSLNVVKALRHYLKPEITLIAVGGISSKEQAQAYFSAGAQLVQIYTGLVYQGPSLIKQILSSNKIN